MSRCTRENHHRTCALFSYASTLDFGQYSRLEQLQKRLWYFSYLKYPITSLYQLLTNPSRSILSADQPSISYSLPCAGCSRCRPSLVEDYHAAQQQQTKSSYFSRFYQSNRSNSQPTIAEVPRPMENPECGLEYSLPLSQNPVELRANVMNDEHSFRLEIYDQFKSFNYDQTRPPSQSLNVQRIRFHPNDALIAKHLLINHDKTDPKSPSIEYRIDLSEKTLKVLQINPQSSFIEKSTARELEEEALEKKGIFLFSRRIQSF